MYRSICALVCFSAFLPVTVVRCTAQSPKDVRAVAKEGQSAIPKVALYLNSRSLDTRLETVRQLTALGGKDSIDPLIQATRDADPEMQIRATDGLVNYYLPGYVKQGLGSSLVRAGNSVKARFSDNNDQTVDPFVVVRPDVIAALGRLAAGGDGMDSRANACRATGILRGQAGVSDLLDALRTKDNTVMYEALIALQKIRNTGAGPRITYLVRDLNDRVQTAAIETVGLLRATEALPALRGIVASPRNARAARAALDAIAMMPEPQDRDLLVRQIAQKDDRLRASAVEGLGRLGMTDDAPLLQQVWHEEEKMLPRLASAFSLVMQPTFETNESSPFRYLINTLNSSAHRDEAYAYLVESARHTEVLKVLHANAAEGSRDEKIYLARVMAVSGNQDSTAILEKISRDNDLEVAKEGLRALRSLKARMGT